MAGERVKKVADRVAGAVAAHSSGRGRRVVKGVSRSASSGMAATAGVLGRRTYLGLDYPTTADNAPRYGYGRPSHARLSRILGERHDRFQAALDVICAYEADFRSIDLRPDPGSLEPAWVNGWLPGLDGAAIYAALRSKAPANYVEIGSGQSTRFAARAKRDGRLDTRIMSIDPYPRAEVDQLCDDVQRSPLESVDLSVFARLQAGDVLFLDGSHRVFMNSDVTVFFLDLLPELPAGVLVGVHDVYLPDDYEPAVADRFYSEQYLLAAYLLAGSSMVQPTLPAKYVSDHPDFRATLDRLWGDPHFDGVERHGDAFWFTTGTP